MKQVIKKAIFGVYLIGMILLLTVCNSQLDIQQNYKFTITSMPVQKSIAHSETAEIRMKINREGYFDETKFYIRYFQPDGDGELKLEDGTILLPNDLYALQKEEFRLYYTSNSTEQQKIDIYVEDNFGQIEHLTFSFNNRRVDKSE